MYDRIRPGRRVTILVYSGISREGPVYRPRTGRAVLLGPAGWVLNMGGRHGRPEIATPQNVMNVK